MVDFYGYLNIACATIGMLIFIYCIIIVNNILKLLPKAKINKNWKVIGILICFFVVGYIINIIAVLLENNIILLIMQSLVYLFGAVFVLLVVRLSFKTYKILVESAEED